MSLFTVGQCAVHADGGIGTMELAKMVYGGQRDGIGKVGDSLKSI